MHSISLVTIVFSRHNNYLFVFANNRTGLQWHSSMTVMLESLVKSIKYISKYTKLQTLKPNYLSLFLRSNDVSLFSRLNYLSLFVNYNEICSGQWQSRAKRSTQHISDYLMCLQGYCYQNVILLFALCWPTTL